MSNEKQISPLNKQICEIISGIEVDHSPGGGGWLDADSILNKAKEIEILFLQEQIRTLEMLHKPEYTTFILKYAEFKEGTTEELTPAHLMDGYELIAKLTEDIIQLQE